MVIVKITGRKDVTRYTIDLTKNVDSALTWGNNGWMRKVRKSAKLRAPRDTGDLAESIKLKKTKTKGKIKQWMIVADTRYAAAQELGFKPHYAPVFGSTKMSNSVYFVKKSTPFLQPAIDANMVKLDTMIKEAIEKSTK